MESSTSGSKEVSLRKREESRKHVEVEGGR